MICISSLKCSFIKSLLLSRKIINFSPQYGLLKTLLFINMNNFSNSFFLFIPLKIFILLSLIFSKISIIVPLSWVKFLSTKFLINLSILSFLLLENDLHLTIFKSLSVKNCGNLASPKSSNILLLYSSSDFISSILILANFEYIFLVISFINGLVLNISSIFPNK